MKFELIQSVILVVIVTLIGFGNLPLIVCGGLAAIMGLVLNVNLIIRYIKEWNRYKRFLDKPKFVLEISFVFIYCTLLCLICVR